ncbi:unnamed protein product, partial [Mesorhabditis spiculigera]
MPAANPNPFQFPNHQIQEMASGSYDVQKKRTSRICPTMKTFCLFLLAILIAIVISFCALYYAQLIKWSTQAWDDFKDTANGTAKGRRLKFLYTRNTVDHELPYAYSTDFQKKLGMTYEKAWKKCTTVETYEDNFCRWVTYYEQYEK